MFCGGDVGSIERSINIGGFGFCLAGEEEGEKPFMLEEGEEG